MPSLRLVLIQKSEDFSLIETILLKDRGGVKFSLVDFEAFHVAAQNLPRKTVPWPVINISLLDGPGETISRDYFGLLPTTRSGKECILLVTDNFSRHAAMGPVSTSEFSSLGTTNILVSNRYPKWGYTK